MQQTYLVVWPSQLFVQSNKLLRLRGTLILKSSLFPSTAFCQLGVIATGDCQGTDFQATLPVCLWLVFLLLSLPHFLLPLVLQCCTVWLRVYIPLEHSVGLSHLAHGVKAIIHTNTQYTHTHTKVGLKHTTGLTSMCTHIHTLIYM